MGAFMMDKLLFVPSVARSEWLHDILPWMSLLELPVAGRRFIEYALESAQKFRFRLMGVIDCHLSKRLRAYGTSLSERGVPIVLQEYHGDLPRGLNDLDRETSPFTNPAKDGLVVVWGLCLTSHKPEDVTLEPLSEEACRDTPVGIYCRKDGRWMSVCPHGLAVKDVNSWHRMSFTVLENEWLFTLPGYSAEQGVHLGRNVVMERGTNVVPPVIMQDNTWCARNVRIDGDVIVGQGSFIGEGTHLKNTVIGDDTYVGVGLSLENKIVVGHRVIDVATGAWTDVEEPGIARSIRSFGSGWFGRLWRFVQGSSKGRRG